MTIMFLNDLVIFFKLARVFFWIDMRSTFFYSIQFPAPSWKVANDREPIILQSTLQGQIHPRFDTQAWLPFKMAEGTVKLVDWDYN
jgi:hypothetical protein